MLRMDVKYGEKGQTAFAGAILAHPQMPLYER